MTALINYLNEGYYVIDDVHNGLFRMIANHWFAKPLKDVTKEERKLVPRNNIYAGMFRACSQKEKSRARSVPNLSISKKIRRKPSMITSTSFAVATPTAVSTINGWKSSQRFVKK